MTFINEPEIQDIFEILKDPPCQNGIVCICQTEAFCVGDILTCKYY